MKKLYLIQQPNNTGYFIEADSMEFNSVGRGVQFKVNGEIVYIADYYMYVMLLTDEMFNERFPFVAQSGYIKSNFIKRETLMNRDYKTVEALNIPLY